MVSPVQGHHPQRARTVDHHLGQTAVSGASTTVDRHCYAHAPRTTRPKDVKTRGNNSGRAAAHAGGREDMDVNLDFFGLGGDRRPGDPGVGYSVTARGAVAGANYQLGDTPLWIGLRYTLAQTSIGFDVPVSGLPGVSTADFDLRLAGFTPSLTLDTRDNFFTPTKGWYVDLSAAVFREAFGGDRDFEKPALTAMWFRPLGRSLYLGVRGSAKGSSGGTPFYL